MSNPIDEAENVAVLLVLVVILVALGMVGYTFRDFFKGLFAGDGTGLGAEAKKTGAAIAKASAAQPPEQIAQQEQTFWDQEAQMVQANVDAGMSRPDAAKAVVAATPDAVPWWPTWGDYWNRLWAGDLLPWNLDGQPGGGQQ